MQNKLKFNTNVHIMYLKKFGTRINKLVYFLWQIWYAIWYIKFNFMYLGFCPQFSTNVHIIYNYAPKGLLKIGVIIWFIFCGEFYK